MTTEEKITAWLIERSNENKWFFESVFEYVYDMPESGMLTSGRADYSDGRARIFLNPRWEKTVEEVRAKYNESKIKL